MEKRSLILFGVIIVLLVAGMFGYAYLKKQELREFTPDVLPPDVSNEEVPYSQIDRITAKHFIVGNTHTFAGSVVLPTPCDLLEVEARVLESFPEQIILDFKVINTAEVCAQVLTEQRFLVSAEASNQAEIRAQFMGRPIELNLVPALPGEQPEDFELFIKG